MAEIITVTDLPAAVQSHELVDAMVAGANAKASRVAPCLTWTGDPVEEPIPTADQLAEAKLVLIGAVKRWVEAGSGALATQQAGPYAMGLDTRQKSTGFNLWPSEIESLQDICKGDGEDDARSAFSVDTAPSGSAHAPYCDLMFGGAACSCGANLTNYAYPLYELG